MCEMPFVYTVQSEDDQINKTCFSKFRQGKVHLMVLLEAQKFGVELPKSAAVLYSIGSSDCLRRCPVLPGIQLLVLKPNTGEDSVLCFAAGHECLI